MIRTRYCSEPNLDQFTQELQNKGYQIVETTTISNVVQVKYKITEVANSVFEASLHQLRNGNTSDGE